MVEAGGGGDVGVDGSRCTNRVEVGKLLLRGLLLERGRFRLCFRLDVDLYLSITIRRITFGGDLL
jgi:hypothetical protein